MNKTESFKDEAEAFAQIEAKNWHAVTLDIPAESNDFHWHDFDAVVYITKGELVLTVEGMDGPVSCGRGTKINATAGVVHREESKGYSAIIGFAQAPETLTQPINKAPCCDGTIAYEHFEQRPQLATRWEGGWTASVVFPRCCLV